MNTIIKWRALSMQEIGDKAVETLKKGFNCAQSVLEAHALKLGLDSHTALRVASGFGGGMGRLMSVCGAVTGAFMAIGCRHGMTKEGESGAKEKTYALVQEFAREFQALHGSTICRDLIGCDLNTPEGQKHYKDNDLFRKCSQLVHDASVMLERYLADVGK